MIGYNQRRVVAQGLAVALMISSLPVLAAPTYSTTVSNVAVHDIDLSTSTGADMLQKRVDSRIRLACAPVEFGGPVAYDTREQAKAVDDCLAAAKASTAPQVRRLIAAGNSRMASN